MSPKTSSRLLAIHRINQSLFGPDARKVTQRTITQLRFDNIAKALGVK